MKKLHKILALLLAMVLCVSLLAACSSSEDTGDTEDTDSNAPSDTNGDTTDDEILPFEDEEVVIYMMYTNDYSDLATVEAAINELVSAELGMTVKLNGFSMGDYGNQLSLAISGGETVDLAAMTPIPNASFASITSSGQAKDISGLVEEYCPTIMAEMGQYMDAFKMGDAVYGLPIARQKASSSYFRYRTDIAEELGLVEQIDAIETWDDFDAIFSAVRENTDVYPLAGSRTLNGRINGLWAQDHVEIVAYDQVGDQVSLVYGGEDGKAHSLVENEDYIFMLQQLADWNNAGYVWGDTATNGELTATQLIDGGIAFCEFVATEFGAENDAQAATYPVTYKKIGEGMVTSSAMTIWATFVPVTSEATEAALAFVDYAYQSSELMNLMMWGVEGTHYTLNDNGEACYLEGAAADSCGYHNSDWMFGNSFILAPWEGQGSDFRTLAKEDMENSVASQFLGFSLNTSAMTEQIASLSSVYEEYGNAMLSGLYTDSLMDEFVSALNNAGLEDYVTEINTQLEAWQNG